MTLRTNNDDVNALMGTTGEDYTFFITLASQLVDEELAAQGYTTNRLTRIEAFLAAHYVVLAREGGGITRTSVGASSESYRVPGGKGFASTRYGEQALAL